MQLPSSFKGAGNRPERLPRYFQGFHRVDPKESFDIVFNVETKEVVFDVTWN